MPLIPKKIIVLYASEVAACIGKNPFVTVPQAALRVWKRTHAESYKIAFEDYKIENSGVINKVTEGISLHERIIIPYKPFQNVKNLEEIDKSKISLNTKPRTKNLSLDFESAFIIDLNKTKEEEEKEHVPSEKVMKFFDAGEEKALDDLQSSTGIIIRKRNDRFYKRYFHVNDVSFALGGKVDGISDDKIIVEVKNRMYKISPFLPLHEKIQVFVYMMITGFPECGIVQKFKNNYSIEYISFEEDFWKEIKFDISLFVKKMEELFNDKITQNLLISSDIFDVNDN